MSVLLSSKLGTIQIAFGVVNIQLICMTEIMKFLLLLTSLIFFTQPGFAANQFVRCVQEQLVIMGENPGPIDGALGKRTRLALNKAISGKPQFQSLPRISNRFAVTWCRELSTISFRTRSRIPFFDGIIMKSDLLNGSPIDGYIKEEIVGLRIWYAKKFNMRTASRPVVIVAQSGKSAVSMAQKAAKEIGIKDVGVKSIRKRCKSPENGRAAFAGPHIMYFCFTNLKDNGATLTPETSRFLSFAVPHEYFHSVQHELAADKVPRFYKTGSRPPIPHLRPSWLVEGSADYFAHLYRFEKVPNSRLRGWVFDMAAPYKHTLQTISKESRLTNGEHYVVSFLAAQLLGDRNDANSFINYWTMIGQGIKHSKAFRVSFGIDRVAFEEQFETLRADRKAAQKFVLSVSKEKKAEVLRIRSFLADGDKQPTTKALQK